MADGPYCVEYGVLTDMLSEEVEAHLADSGQRNELLSIEVDEPGKEVRSVLDGSGYTGRPRSAYKFTGKRATLDFDSMLGGDKLLGRDS